MTVSKIFQKAVQQGGQILENGCVYTYRYGKRNPNLLIQRTIAPNGSYAIQLSEQGNITKKVNKTILNETSSVVDSWDFTRNKGVHLSSVVVNPGKSSMTRAFDKTGEQSISPDGSIYLWRKGDSGRYSTPVKTLDGITSVAKPFSPLGWLNDQFYKLFNK